jgi:hypothetical protein
MNLTELVGDDWRKVCFQGPYTIKDTFNKYSGENIDSILSLSSDEIGFWVFYDNHPPKAAIVNRSIIDIVRTKKSSSCTTRDNPYIYAYYNQGVRELYFYDSNY